MVNFGGHLKAVREGENQGTELFLVPYNVIKQIIYEVEVDLESIFLDQWTKSCTAACQDLERALEAFWTEVFSVVMEDRGAPPGTALQRFVEQTEDGHELLTRLTHLHTAAVTNTEALRKIVKKYDKNKEAHLSQKLLPKLYSSVVYTAQAVIEDTIGMLRRLLLQEDDDDNRFRPLSRLDSDTQNKQVTERLVQELGWLKRLVSSIPGTLLPRLVAHRGFHHIGDRQDKRPLENSLAAYETAWSSGIQLCECDIALTKDEKLVLAHDEDFQRLALDSTAINSKQRVSDLTFRELMSLPLKSGLRPPLLMDVLRSAHAISDDARLIIEIKPGHDSAASALARLLLRHPDLCRCVHMIMSFDAVTMHSLRAELSIAQHDPLSTSRLNLTGQLGSHHRRLVSFDHCGAGLIAPFPPSPSRSSSPKGIGLDLSQTSLDERYEPVNFGDETTAETPHCEPQEPIPFVPKLMLLTVSDPPKRPCELQVGIDDLSPIDGWLTSDEGSLDGVYLQFQKEMMTPEGAAKLKSLSDHGFSVGIWGYSGKDPDNWETFRWLTSEANVTFVNTDLPTHFRKDILVRTESR